jgi:predicted O-linked N-acetylglucosamine transferase (SPINDLY family)
VSEAERDAGAVAAAFARAVAHQQAGELEQAVDAYRAALALRPDHVQALNNLGVALKNLGRFDEAVEVLRRCLALQPGSAAVHLNHGNSLNALRRFDEAEAAFREAVRLSPDYAQAHRELASLLYATGRMREAVEPYRELVRIDPHNSEARFFLGMLLHGLGEPGEVKDHFRVAVDHGPPPLGLFSNLLFLQQSMPQYSQEERLAEARRFGETARSRATQPYVSWLCEDRPTRLRVGIVSGDLRDHVVGFYMENLLKALDYTRIELFAYPTLATETALTQRIKPCFSAWRPIQGLRDQEAAALIHQDGLHVLLDLSGHTAHNRLALFAWRPAPVQASWIGYFGTTGMAEIDYFVADPYLIPPEDEAHFVEEPWRLPAAGCLTPPDVAIEPNALPVLSEGVFTFGCLNNFDKVSDDAVALWSRILREAPASRLLLKSGQVGNPDIQARTRSRFAAHGVGPERLVFEGWSPRDIYFETYHRVDVALDPFPFPGATTSIEGLWMGVPVITRRGDRFLSRVGESVAHRAGLPEWIARDDDDYVAKAVGLVVDPSPLAPLRAGLRAKVLASSLFDAPAYARDLQDALWAMWERRKARGTDWPT